MKFRWFRWDETVAVYIALIFAVLSLIITASTALTINDRIRDEVRDAVVVTKVRIAELEAATRIGLARKDFASHGSYVQLRDEVADAASELSAAYLEAPVHEQERWGVLKPNLDSILDSLRQRDRSALTAIDDIVITLRSENLPATTTQQ